MKSWDTIYRRSNKIVCTLLLAAASLAAPLSCAAQATAAGSRLPTPSRLDLYGGYAYFHPFDSAILGYEYAPIEVGAVTSVTGYFGRHLGAQIEGEFSPHGSNDCFYSAQAGPVFRSQFGRLIPFAHLLAGSARLGGPVVQPCTWGIGVTSGLGLDYVLPTQSLRNHVGLRLFQADFEFADVNFGAATAPTYLNGGDGKITAYRLSAGVVLRLGEPATSPTPAFACDAQPVNIFPGDPVIVTGRILDSGSTGRAKPVFRWSTTGGSISGSAETATVSTAALAPGDYTITGRVSEGGKSSRHALCAASFRVHGHEPPTIACSANPSTIMPGSSSTIASEARSPQNRQLNYSFSSSAGQLSAVAATATLAAIDVNPGVIEITCNVVDDLGQSASSSTTVTVMTPAAPPAPSARPLCSVSFERDRQRPVRVDNEAKGCLDDIALELNRASDANLVLVGKHDPQEKPEAAAERTLNIKLYLTAEKGIDPARIQLRTGESTGRAVENILVPPGATWDTGGTTSFDPARVVRHGEPYAHAPR